MLVVIAGPSGSGKTTVCRRLIERKRYVLSISATTREPRPGEQDGKDYHFIAREEFMRRLERGEFLEHSEHFGNLYGTPRRPVEEALAQGKTVVLEIDVNGARQVKQDPGLARWRAESVAGRGAKALLIFVNAPGEAELHKRLLNRPGCESDEELRQRVARAEMELAQRNLFDHEVVNDDLERAVSEIEDIIDRKNS
jgi:guanylate kinase